MFEPKNREPRSREPSRSRSAISARMPTSDSHAIASIAHSSGGKLPDQRQRERGVDHLPVPGDQGEEQERERDHHHPVRHLDHRPVLEPPVPEHLPGQRRQPWPHGRPPPAGGPTDPHGPHDLARTARKHRDPDDGRDDDDHQAHHLQRIHAATLAAPGAAPAEPHRTEIVGSPPPPPAELVIAAELVGATDELGRE